MPRMELRIREVDKGSGGGKEEALPRKNTEKSQESGDPEIQAAKGRQTKGEASFLDLFFLAYFAS